MSLFTVSHGVKIEHFNSTNVIDMLVTDEKYVNIPCITPSHSRGSIEGSEHSRFRMPDLDRTGRGDARDNQFTLSAVTDFRVGGTN